MEPRDRERLLLMFKLFRSSASSSDLFSSARSGDVKRARKTLNSGVEIDSRDATGRTPLCLACKYARLEVIKLFLKMGADVNARDQEGRSPLFHAIYSRSSEAVGLVVQAGADLNMQDNVGYSPYRYAVSRSHTQVLNLLRTPDEG